MCLCAHAILAVVSVATTNHAPSDDAPTVTSPSPVRVASPRLRHGFATVQLRTMADATPGATAHPGSDTGGSSSFGAGSMPGRTVAPAGSRLAALRAPDVDESGGAVGAAPSDAELIAAVAALRASDPDLSAVVEASAEVLDRALLLFPVREISFSFNGGKDSTVCLELLRLVLARRALVRGHDTRALPAAAEAGASPSALSQVRMVFFTTKDNFSEMLDFIAETVTRYGLLFREYADFKGGLRHLLSSTPVRAIVLGTRRGDPHGADLAPFSPTTSGWPAMMRVNPILDWSYAHVWRFLRDLRLPYCRLYDAGYTSVGTRADSVPNPMLGTPTGSPVAAATGAPGTFKRSDGDSVRSGYRPAYELSDGAAERDGRGAYARSLLAERASSASASASGSAEAADSDSGSLELGFGHAGDAAAATARLADAVRAVKAARAQASQVEVGVVVVGGAIGDTSTARAVAVVGGAMPATARVACTSFIGADCKGDDVTAACDDLLRRCSVVVVCCLDAAAAGAVSASASVAARAVDSAAALHEPTKAAAVTDAHSTCAVWGSELAGWAPVESSDSDDGASSGGAVARGRVLALGPGAEAVAVQAQAAVAHFVETVAAARDPVVVQ